MYLIGVEGRKLSQWQECGALSEVVNQSSLLQNNSSVEEREEKEGYREQIVQQGQRSGCYRDREESGESKDSSTFLRRGGLCSYMSTPSLLLASLLPRSHTLSPPLLLPLLL